MKKLLSIFLFSFVALSAMQNNEQMLPSFTEISIEILAEQQSQELQELFPLATVTQQSQAHNLSGNAQSLTPFPVANASSTATYALLQTNASSRKKHECSQCGKAFKYFSHLKKHIRTHTGEKLEKCPWNGCNKSFNSFSNLTRHIRTHTGERPHKCDWEGCAKAFSDPSNLTRHKKNIHKEITE